MNQIYRYVGIAYLTFLVMEGTTEEGLCYGERIYTEKGLSDRRGSGWRLLTSVGNWHVRVRSSQPRTSLPAQPSYNHPPLLVTEAATPHCTL